MNCLRNERVGEADGEGSMIGIARPFTLIELLVVIGVIAILASLLLPALVSARQRAHVTICASNLKQISTGFNYYIDDFCGYFPWSYVPVSETSNDPWKCWVLTLGGDGNSYGLNYLPSLYSRPGNIGAAKFSNSSLWLCPTQAKSLNDYIGASANNWQMVAKYGMSYAYPIYTGSGRYALGGSPALTSRPAKIVEIQSPSTTMNLIERGDADSYYGANTISVGISPYFPTAIGRHLRIGGGTNLLSVDSHVTYYANGMDLLSQWVRGSTGTPCQTDPPFNTGFN